ncbi:type II secretion system protein A [Thiogranum longum]|uniref:Type II secretion system protein A n=1 Tax=Thiogranum longum TaxID=1537524 RepID=A0A4R1H635_9GAMM|nr:AAA family ATPase [Thiogranum longum]TCK17184.1 type II secretion system protein A [Thiogranum longum]
MYEQHFGLTERPFSIAPDPRFLYMSQQHREALAHLLYGVGEGGGFVQLTGEVGTGKTTICRCLLEQVPDHVDVALILNPRVSAIELLASLCDELGINFARDTDSIKALTDLLNAHLLEMHAQGRRTVLIIDEAQNLDADALEQVRLLTNLETTREKLLQIVLIGQPELRSLLAREELRQLSQRITARYHLEPIQRNETAAYIRHRLQVCGASETIFTDEAIDMVQKLSGGVPRLINVMCDRAMLGAYVEGKRKVDVAIVVRAAGEVLPEEGLDAPSGHEWWRWLAAAVAAVFVVAFVIGYWQEPARNAVMVTNNPVGGPAGAPLAAGSAQTEPVVAAREPDPGPGVSNQAETNSGKSRPDVIGEAGGVVAVDAARLHAGGNATLEQRLADASPVAAAKAWAGLFRLWGVQSAANTDAQACAAAPAVGLRCLQGGGSRTVLQYFDRPAVLLLVGAGGRRVPVLLQEIRGGNALLQIDGQPIEVPLDTMEGHWFGEYRLLWKTPPGGSPVLRPGDRSPVVKWLREKLKLATGLSSIAPDPLFFDEGLKTLVQDFQRSHELNADGVVGARTFIHLNNLSRQPTVPRLGVVTAQ